MLVLRSCLQINDLLKMCTAEIKHYMHMCRQEVHNLPPEFSFSLAVTFTNKSQSVCAQNSDLQKKTMYFSKFTACPLSERKKGPHNICLFVYVRRSPLMPLNHLAVSR
jgi:hypothetical protein